LFQRYGVEDQLSAMYQPVVQLKSGGYLVINPTEALVSIDINSGRSTREHNIEQTAFATNLEAANEIARQLRLRDMAGLIVIDFIDMEQNSHVRKVEKAMKEALKNDRARIQVGRISSFGLMEMSRQRLRTGVLEASTKPCAHCEGTGLMRTASSAGLSALRMIEDEAARGRGEKILLRAGREAAIYLLNKKRSELAEIEARYGVSIEVAIDEGLEGARMSVESSGPRPTAPQRRPEPTPIEEDLEEVEALLGDEADEDEEEEESEERETSRSQEDRPGRRRRRRRRGGRGRGRREDGEGQAETVEAEGADVPEEAATEEPVAEEAEPTGDKKRRRRRGKRSGSAAEGPELAEVSPDSSPMAETLTAEEPPIAEVEAPTEPQPKARKSRAKAKPKKDDAAEDATASSIPAEEAAEDKPAKPARKPRAKKAKADEKEPASEPAAPTADNDESDDEPGSRPRSGWWQRTFG
jgi:ribonuclease E